MMIQKNPVIADSKIYSGKPRVSENFLNDQLITFELAE